MTAERALLERLVDDAGLFPPTQLTMAAALARHRADQAESSGMLTHRFLCPASRIAELRELLQAGDRIRVGLIADTGAAGLAPAVAAVAADPRLALSVLEFPLAKAAGRAEPAGALDAVLDTDLDTVLDVIAAQVDADVSVFVEPSRLADAVSLAAAMAAHDEGTRLGMKLRCGGVRADLFPQPDDLAAALVVAASDHVTVKATAGLHHAVRHTDPRTGFTHHGFLNLLLATADAVAGAGVDQVAATLRVTDPAALVKRAAGLDPAAVAATRRGFAAYGSCSTSTPLQEARDLGLWA
ncbi:hypothetical protein NGB36_14045 [Streptomyces sp. RB6PN25]|uniref:Aldolase n=1 Tax=Streptomyces humicola TaxID=2953240 RepID=A0ABT1PX78_9ACTN|nr:hypothetical protein [Streptomyces humicola]MCQ4081698.1 hypothetical protein [Streptomyces humicola]